LNATNPQGIAAGEFMQLIAPDIEGQSTGWMAFNEKQRAHPIIREMSSFRQKVTAGTWGCILRMPASISAMLGL